MRRLFLFALFLAQSSFAQSVPSADEVFATPPSVEAQVWLDDALTAYNERMLALRRDWLANVTGTRSDFLNRRMIFETSNGTVAFDARAIGGIAKHDGKPLWNWAWASDALPSDYRIESAEIRAIGEKLKLPFLVTPFFFSNSPDFPYLASAVVIKIHGGVGIHRVHVPRHGDPYDLYFLLSNPRRGDK